MQHERSGTEQSGRLPHIPARLAGGARGTERNTPFRVFRVPRLPRPSFEKGNQE